MVFLDEWVGGWVRSGAKVREHLRANTCLCDPVSARATERRREARRNARGGGGGGGGQKGRGGWRRGGRRRGARGREAWAGEGVAGEVGARGRRRERGGGGGGGGGRVVDRKGRSESNGKTRGESKITDNGALCCALHRYVQ